jgi:hypothetical protein
VRGPARRVGEALEAADGAQRRWQHPRGTWR